jgi:hypothetical protein
VSHNEANGLAMQQALFSHFKYQAVSDYLQRMMHSAAQTLPYRMPLAFL